MKTTTTKLIPAKYNQGLIQPMEAIDLKDGEMIQVIIRKGMDQEQAARPSVKKKHSFELLGQLQFKGGPTDGSVNHDKYIYSNPHGR